MKSRFLGSMHENFQIFLEYNEKKVKQRSSHSKHRSFFTLSLITCLKSLSQTSSLFHRSKRKYSI